MPKDNIFNRHAQKLRVPADIVHIAFPILFWALLVLRWCGIWLTYPWMTAVIVLYYVSATAYLFFTFIIKMKVIGIIGLFLTFLSCLFVWIPYNWIFALLLIPAMFSAIYRESKAIAIVFSILAGISVLIIFMFSMLFHFQGLVPEKYAYHISPDGRYAALEYAFTQLPGGTDVYLCRVSGPLLVSERVLYLANYSDFGKEIEWLDQSAIFIYDEKMDAFKDPTIKHYAPF